MGFMSRAKHAWNAFVNNRDPTQYYHDISANFGYHRPDMPRFTRGNERTIVTAIYNRIALDAAQTDIRHVSCNGFYQNQIRLHQTQRV